MNQTTDTILMIRPVNFRKNEETAVNNYFQEDLDVNNDLITKQAQLEFDTFVNKLRAVGVNVIVMEDKKELDTPDSIFPNNWISFHQSGNLGLYPMFAENRRRERREDVLETLEEKGYVISNIMDYTSAEEQDIFLEGTGSIILDRIHRKAYCALSPRADEDLFFEFCEDFEYDPVVFVANQTVKEKRLPIYHTNVMMCLAEEFCIICLDTIDNKKQKKGVVKHLKETNKEIITITEQQMQQFAGNMLQVKGEAGKKFLVMSQAAHESLTAKQIETIEKYNPIISSNLHTIETLGGGSARCMMAEVFLPRTNL